MNSRFATTPDANKQQSSGIRSRHDSVHQETILSKEKVKHIIQFEKVIEKFANKIGLEKKILLNILNPTEKKSITEQSAAFDSINMNPHGSMRPQTSQDFRKQMDTGQAAMLAYTNLANDRIEEVPNSDWRR